MIESSYLQEPILLTSICGHIVDEIIAFKVYGENSGRFGFGNQSLLTICVQSIVNRMGSEPCVEGPAISGISTLTINSGRVSIYICDNNQIILLDEGLKKGNFS
jgi:hypothetical protein